MKPDEESMAYSGMAKNQARYKVTEAARLAGISASTLRLWESQGLVTPERSENGYRYYGEDDLARLRRIVWLRQERGYNPAAIRESLDVRHDGGEPLPSPAPSDTQDDEIGRKLRLLRKVAGKTLDQVAAEVGIAASVLSTFERTSQGVSFRMIGELAHYFGTTVSCLSGSEDGNGSPVVRAGAWKTWPGTTAGVTVQVLAEGRNQMDCHRFVLASGASSEGAYRHEGEEFIHILEGRLELVLDHSEYYDLWPGDSLYFASRRQHSWSNRHDGETVLLWINTPPSF